MPILTSCNSRKSDGTTVNVNLSDLLAVVTVNSADIAFTGNGTATSPLSATLTDSVKAGLKGGTDWTDEFTGLTTGNSVTLTYTPLYPYPLHIYRNGLRQKETIEWRQDDINPKKFNLQGASFGANGQPEIVIADYKTSDTTTPRSPVEH